MMGNLIALIFVVLVIILGIGACWAITANGASTAPAQDTFGNKAPASAIQQGNESASLAVKTMLVLLIAFFIMVCVILVAGVAWFWKTGKSKASKY
jgi:uncharacterized membrane protein YqiK